MEPVAPQTVDNDAVLPIPAGAFLILLILLGSLVLVLHPSAAVAAEQHFLCDGDPLLARVENGPVDAADIPNTAGGTVPGAFVMLEWRDLHLQLPRTNNAGAPSFTDGRWWWSLEDPAHPRFRLRRGRVQEFACSSAP